MNRNEFNELINQMNRDTYFDSNPIRMRSHPIYIELSKNRDGLLQLMITQLENKPDWVIMEFILEIYPSLIDNDFRTIAGDFDKIVIHILKILNIKLRESKLKRICKDT